VLISKNNRVFDLNQLLYPENFQKHIVRLFGLLCFVEITKFGSWLYATNKFYQLTRVIF